MKILFSSAGVFAFTLRFFFFLLYVLWCISSFLCVGEELEGSVVMVECGKLRGSGHDDCSKHLINVAV